MIQFFGQRVLNRKSKPDTLSLIVRIPAVPRPFPHCRSLTSNTREPWLILPADCLLRIVHASSDCVIMIHPLHQKFLRSNRSNGRLLQKKKLGPLGTASVLWLQQLYSTTKDIKTHRHFKLWAYCIYQWNIVLFYLLIHDCHVFYVLAALSVLSLFFFSCFVLMFF